MTELFAMDGPYPDRSDRLPRRLEQVTPAWLTGQLARRYPGIEVHDFEIVECKNSHTTKLRVELDLNGVGQAAGIPKPRETSTQVVHSWRGSPRTRADTSKTARCPTRSSLKASH